MIVKASDTREFSNKTFGWAVKARDRYHAKPSRETALAYRRAIMRHESCYHAGSRASLDMWTEAAEAVKSFP